MSASESEAAGALVESHDDSHETLMTYDKTGRVPRFVILVWTVSLIGFGWYIVQFWLPDFALWGPR